MNKPIEPVKPVEQKSTSKKAITSRHANSESHPTFSSYGNLSRLKNKLQRQHRQQAFDSLNQPRSASIMDAEPFAVAKTILPLTVEQQKALNTSHSHVSAITKNDNGTCTIHRKK